jgi:uncharacterized membrane protein
MATLSVLTFGTPDGARAGLSLIQDLQKQGLITLQDAALVSWPPGKTKPETQQLVDLRKAGALNGMFWGMLFGLIFMMPFLGAAVGALSGALGGHFADYGIDDRFIADVRSKVSEGTSALFLLTSNAVVDRVLVEMRRLPKFELLSTNLPKEEEDALRAAFAD